MNLLGAIVVWMATVFAVASRDTLSGALVGLSVTYAMDVSMTRFCHLGTKSVVVGIRTICIYILKPDYQFYLVIK